MVKLTFKGVSLAFALVAGALLIGFELGAEELRGQPLELAEATAADGSSAELFEQRAKEKEIEAQIRQAAAKLERERAEKMDSRAAAEGEHANAVKDKVVAHDDIEEARKLTSQSVREQNDARLAEQKAQAVEKLLGLKRRVAALTRERAEAVDKQAQSAQEAADSVKSKVESLKAEIHQMHRMARAKSYEAEERVKVAKKLISKAKKLTVEAKAVQEKYKDQHKLPEKEVVSRKAMDMMKAEARRVAKLLRMDAHGLQSAEDLLHKVGEHPSEPLTQLNNKISDLQARVGQSHGRLLH